MSQIFQDFSSKENLKKAFYYLKQEVESSSLSLDPFWKPVIYAIDFLGNEYFDSLSRFIRAGKYIPEIADCTYAQKDNMGVRPIAVLSITDRIIFQAVLNQVSLGDRIDKQLHTFVYGNRVKKDETYLIPYKIKWGQFCDAQIREFNNGLNWRIELDIQGFYENILIDKLIKILQNELGLKDEKILNILEKQLLTWTENEGSGLSIPQGPNASHVLANAYLHPLDTYVNSLKNEYDFVFFRYVDDMVIMSKNSETAEIITSKVVTLLRKYNLRINEKTKLEKLKNVDTLESLKFFNHYGDINETSLKKIEAIRKKLSRITNRIKYKKEVDKSQLGELKYYLKASNGDESDKTINDLIEVIPNKISLIFPISKFIGQFFSKTKETNKKEKGVIIKKYGDKLWKIYSSNNRLTEWGQYWLLKLLFFPEYFTKTPEFEKYIQKIINRNDNRYLRILCLFYFFYNSDQRKISAPFQIDDIKRYILEAKTPAETAVYYYFLLYFNSHENSPLIQEMLKKGLSTYSSIDVEVICLYILKIQSIEMIPSREYGDFTKEFMGIESGNKNKESNKIHQPYFTFEGKIPTEQFANFLGITNQKNKINKKLKKPVFVNKEIKIEKSVGKLGYRNDGLILFGKDTVNMEAQIKDLCRMFIDKPNALITIDDIKDTIINSNRRKYIKNDTISKYVSKLRIILEEHYYCDVLITQKKEGWRFEPPDTK